MKIQTAFDIKQTKLCQETTALVVDRIFNSR